MNPTRPCPDCSWNLEHCHAAWIRHSDGTEECLAVGCDLDADAHGVHLTCTDVDPFCCRVLNG